MAKQGAKGSRGKDGDGTKTVATNRRARFNYEISETFECGIVLTGGEVKSLRAGEVTLQDSFARVDGGEVWLHGMHIKPYEFAKNPADPTRTRKLLLHRKQIDKLIGTTATSGTTLVPIRVYFTHGLAKVEIGVGRGKRNYDKRQTIKERDAKREAERALRDRSR